MRLFTRLTAEDWQQRDNRTGVRAKKGGGGVERSVGLGEVKHSSTRRRLGQGRSFKVPNNIHFQTFMLHP